MLRSLIEKNRSYRRFDEEYSLEIKTVRELVDNARLSASAANLQPLRYIISSSREVNRLIFCCLRWAGYLPDWKGPVEGERPAGYIVILGDREHPEHHHYDAGIAAQSILLGAVEKGLGGCIFASIDRDLLRKSLDIPEQLDILLAIALGKPKEEVVIKEIGNQDDIKYWRDENGIHYVPKRRLEDIIIGAFD